ncbi:bacterial peptide chain release factor 1 (bRF-1) [Chitinophaga costaii]|uniref:Peptide chain release factor 1 n=1 Tax=Chitinophaga costaii TaxID=1335309 RepID=A0A1C4DWS8_9BACT|nr:peptide chain release factor 1 [Chitinophaga costaii]PUZ27844.1 peptide chain release factor 1 [Chitinophaga costaii]SCC35866.1 bacterial peptide chain release factor 1 (bRF-1) [Chitinophaga costaii]
MIDKLEIIKGRFDQVSVALTNPEIVKDNKQFSKLSKEYRQLEKIVKAHDQYVKLLDTIAFNKEVLEGGDEEMRELAKEETESLQQQKLELEATIRNLLIPKDPQDERNAILEIRAGTGGDEASLFAGDLFRMYQRFCEIKGWSTTLLNETAGSVGGYKEIIMEVNGDDVYGTLKFESGVHRVQRVPATEASGRVHTSAATVAILPEPDEVEVDVRDADIKMDTFRSSGAGGQHVNKTESAVRLTHIPTGVVVECQEGRSQHSNRDIAMKMLRSRIYEAAVRKHEEAIASQRKSLVSTGDRSAKIRTYNFPQGRVTDHRIGMTVYNMDAFLNGDIQDMLEALQFAENAEKLNQGGI